MKFLRFTFPIALFLSQVGFSACPDVRLDKSSLKNVPVLDQDGSGICWAYTAAAMIDAYRFSHGDKNTAVITSPIALAVFANQDAFMTGLKQQTAIRGARNGDGQPDTAIEIARNQGKVCDHRTVSKELISTDIAAIDFDGTYKLDTFEFQCPSFLEKLWYDFFPSTTKMAVTVKHMALWALSGDVKKLCAQLEAPVALPKTQFVSAYTMATQRPPINVADRLKTLLGKQNPQPVGLQYCADVLRKPELQSLDIYKYVSKCDNKHWSVIVGSREGKNGKCDFLVRNSFGSSCDGYSSSTCESRGQIWVTEDSLVNNTGALSWLE